MPTLKLKQRPNHVDAIQWNNNEAEIREFINDDAKLKIGTDDSIKVWNNFLDDWLRVNMFDYIIKWPSGNLTVEAGTQLDKVFERVEQ
jgi:hypothetical protein